MNNPIWPSFYEQERQAEIESQLEARRATDRFAELFPSQPSPPQDGVKTHAAPSTPRAEAAGDEGGESDE